MGHGRIGAIGDALAAATVALATAARDTANSGAADAPQPRLPRPAGPVHGGAPDRRLLGATDRDQPEGDHPGGLPAVRASPAASTTSNAPRRRSAVEPHDMKPPGLSVR